MQTIELDCDPWSPRPDTFLPGILEGTGLEHRAKDKPVGMFFGNWTWDFSDVPAEEWKKIREITKVKIKALYEAGRIRYGSW